MKTPNIIYLHRINDGAYFIYKLSKYGREKIKLIDVGLAFGKGGNYTPKFKSLKKEYNLEQYESGTHVTTDSFEDFCDSIYLGSAQMKIVVDSIPLPSTVFNELEQRYLWNEKRKRDKLLFNLRFEYIKNKDEVEKVIDELKKNDVRYSN